MSALVHIILMLGYVIVAVFAAVALPGVFPDISTMEARLFGGGIFLLGVQVHTFLIMRANKEDTTDRLMSLHQDYQVYIDQLDQYKEETIQLRDNLQSSEQSHNKEIVNEMRLLQTLLSQVSHSLIMLENSGMIVRLKWHMVMTEKRMKFLILCIMRLKTTGLTSIYNQSYHYLHVK